MRTDTPHFGVRTVTLPDATSLLYDDIKEKNFPSNLCFGLEKLINSTLFAAGRGFELKKKIKLQELNL